MLTLNIGNKRLKQKLFCMLIPQQSQKLFHNYSLYWLSPLVFHMYFNGIDIKHDVCIYIVKFSLNCQVPLISENIIFNIVKYTLWFISILTYSYGLSFFLCVTKKYPRVESIVDSPVISAAHKFLAIQLLDQSIGLLFDFHQVQLYSLCNSCSERFESSLYKISLSARYFLSIWHTLEVLGMRKPQLRNFLLTVSGRHFFSLPVNIGVPRPLWVVPSSRQVGLGCVKRESEQTLAANH